MSFSKLTATFGTLALLSSVSAHGIVSGIVANGAWQSGYDPSFQYSNPPPVVAGWSMPQVSDRGFVSDYTSPDIICHRGATPGGSYVSVAAGDSIELQWTEWPESHHGPVIDYLAACGDDCTNVDKTQLLFNKIDEAGLNNGNPAPGNWASDDLIANNNSWTVTIPSSIAPGRYVLRHEIIALHSAFDAGGAQNYPQCINLEVSGSGTDSLSSGTKGTELYTAQDPGILLSIYYPTLTDYSIPGPALIGGSSSGPQPSVSASASATSAAPSTDTSSASATSSSASVDITASPARPSAVVSPTDDLPSPVPTTTADSDSATTTVESSSTTTVTATVAPTASQPEETDSATDVPPIPLPTPVPAPGSSTTAPVSFTSTVTGRIGKPTRFVCYIEDDEFTLSPA
ncbi:murein transglycosylase [Cladophialophora yegresii CBS 114405]|uniref:Murein transglycosylase n=1 Tax=Cladophialophora yegresii CBS 114405 TaxID=1182544 RepID=W9VIU8_9EURO|nr:murein transglycosylase [Cladophialophora yegresii CBS 114405]EXJ55612.1 murein transglycosylase [Cladophialophora yegresii CBS 114405]